MNIQGNAVDLSQQFQQKKILNAQVQAAINGTAIRIYEQLCVRYLLEKGESDVQIGENPELTPDELQRLADMCAFCAPHIYVALGMAKMNPERANEP